MMFYFLCAALAAAPEAPEPEPPEEAPPVNEESAPDEEPVVIDLSGDAGMKYGTLSFDADLPKEERSTIFRGRTSIRPVFSAAYVREPEKGAPLQLGVIADRTFWSPFGSPWVGRLVGSLVLPIGVRSGSYEAKLSTDWGARVGPLTTLVGPVFTASRQKVGDVLVPAALLGGATVTSVANFGPLGVGVDGELSYPLTQRVEFESSPALSSGARDVRFGGRLSMQPSNIRYGFLVHRVYTPAAAYTEVGLSLHISLVGGEK